MTLEEQLRFLRRDLLHDRSDAISGDDDHLWSDATLIAYIDEANRRFAKKSLCLRDILTITTVPYQKEYPIDASTIAVISARFQGNGAWYAGAYVAGTTADDGTFTPTPQIAPIRPDQADLARGGHSQFDQYVPQDRLYFNVNDLSTTQPSKPMAFDTDEFVTTNGQINVRLFPLCSPAYGGCNVELRICRLPLVLSEDDMQASSEISTDYHLTILDYAAYLALRIDDQELGNPQAAATFEASFNKKAEEARVEMLRKMFAPQVWGFGRNGFSYTPN